MENEIKSNYRNTVTDPSVAVINVKTTSARTAPVGTVLHRNVIPPPPKIRRKELEAINRNILASAAEIHPDDWK